MEKKFWESTWVCVWRCLCFFYFWFGLPRLWWHDSIAGVNPCPTITWHVIGSRRCPACCSKPTTALEAVDCSYSLVANWQQFLSCIVSVTSSILLVCPLVCLSSSLEPYCGRGGPCIQYMFSSITLWRRLGCWDCVLAIRYQESHASDSTADLAYWWNNNELYP